MGGVTRDKLGAIVDAWAKAEKDDLYLDGLHPRSRERLLDALMTAQEVAVPEPAPPKRKR